jgi:hypothetical protein
MFIIALIALFIAHGWGWPPFPRDLCRGFLRGFGILDGAITARYFFIDEFGSN